MNEEEHNTHNPMTLYDTVEISLQLFPHSAQVLFQQVPEHMYMYGIHLQSTCVHYTYNISSDIHVIVQHTYH